jgi:heavy metal translocating P-type ATPase
VDHAKADRLDTFLIVIALAGLVAGLGLQLGSRPDLAQTAWFAGVVPVLAALLVEILRSLVRGEVGLDIVAALSMSAALTFGETLAAAVVAVMYSGGTFLESFAEGRARREMRDLLSRVPRTATRHHDGGLEEVPLDDIVPGDRLLIRQGDVVPVDGRIASGSAFLDTAALTGESLPVWLDRDGEAMSGSTNAGDAFDLTATHEAKDSTYAGIVRLVETAQASKAPMARLADRWSLGFLAVTVAIAFAAWWYTGDPIRAVAVLVVATPCPLILAVPVALVAGLSRAAHFGVLVKGAKPLEAMARVRTLILDKTGTLTDGRPQIVSIDSAGEVGADDILRYAAALDQASKHPVAQAIVSAAKARGLTLPVPADVAEIPGEGVVGVIDGRQVVVGGEGFVAARAGRAPGDHPALAAGSVMVAVALDGRMAGHLVMSDPLREGAAEMLAALRRQGVQRILLATGDRAEVAARVTDGLGLDGIHAGLTPEEKVLLVIAEHANGPVMMVGHQQHHIRRRCRRCDGRARGCRQRRSGGCGAAGGPRRPHRTGHRDRAPVAAHRDAKRGRRDRPVGSGHGCRGPWIPDPGAGGPDPGGNRRRRHPERAARAAHLSGGALWSANPDRTGPRISRLSRSKAPLVLGAKDRTV